MVKMYEKSVIYEPLLHHFFFLINIYFMFDCIIEVNKISL